jgi:hypothetical protein
MKASLKATAYREAAALLEADMSAADLQCDVDLSEKDASAVREFIRNDIVDMLNLLADVQGKKKR